jgi:putative SOS response-associated peptidase YedK
VIITGASDQGLVGIHDRRPFVLAADEARRWLDPTLTGSEAEQISLKDGRPVAEYVSNAPELSCLVFTPSVP